MKAHFSQLLILLFIACSWNAFATHNRAGEITYVQTGDLTVIATVTTYTKASSEQADRDTLTIEWGDGTMSRIPRINGSGQGVFLPGDLRYNIYQGEHTYPGRSTYTMSVRDPNRIGNILNINGSNSISVQFFLETTFTFLNPQFQGYNSSAILFQRPIDEACVGQRFVHNPNAYDPNNDSLSFQLIVPLEDEGSPVPRFVLPSSVLPGVNNNISFDTQTGEFIWDAPQLAGEYNIAFRINEHRNGILINSIVRDMQITVRNCDNRPPNVLTDDLICVVAGERIDLPVAVSDPDNGQLVKLEGTGGPFLLTPSPAQLIVADGYQDKPLLGQFQWDTKCEHIAQNDYSIVFKGEDNFFNPTIAPTGLVDLHTLRIHVSGPAPQQLEALSVNQAIQLQWAAPYNCENTLNSYFRGFTIWRAEIPTEVIQDTCGTNLARYGYAPIKFQVNELQGDHYIYLDETVEKGITYCYRITAEFAQLSPGQIPFNRVQSLPSDEICLQVSRDIPLITHVTVDETNITNGKITIRWVPPLSGDLDTTENPGPYRYQLLRSDGIGTSNFIPIAGAQFDAATFSELVDFRLFVDENINTLSMGYTYVLDFFSSDLTNIYGQSQSASSVFLTPIGSDRRVSLNWIYDVPWFVKDHVIYRENIVLGAYDSIGITSKLTYADLFLENEKEYCYYVKSIGSYGLQDIPSPQENFSQIACAVAVDSVPPCTPVISVTNNCENLEGEPITELINMINWNYAGINCLDTMDIDITDIYFISDFTQDTILLESLSGLDIRTYTHILSTDDIGCYFIQVTDVNGNVGLRSTIICSETCPEYELPNAFTPNGDGANDLFTPYPYRFISRVDMKIFTRWGTLVFETEDPAINWDGTDLNGNDVIEDVYYYTCDAFSGGSLTEFIKQKTLQGFITLVRE